MDSSSRSRQQRARGSWESTLGGSVSQVLYRDNQPNRGVSGRIEQLARRCSAIMGWVRVEKLRNCYFVPGLICVWCGRILWGSRLYWTLSARTWRRWCGGRLMHRGAKFSLKNKRGFNAQHQCTLKGNSTWVALLICGSRAQRNWLGGQWLTIERTLYQRPTRPPPHQTLISRLSCVGRSWRPDWCNWLEMNDRLAYCCYATDPSPSPTMMQHWAQRLAI